MNNINIQPILENDNVRIEPLLEKDFDALYAVASDPKVWEQHPNKDRYREEVFRVFFRGAVESKGAFKIIEKCMGDVIGSSRYYDYDTKENAICIGYTFYGTKSWGKGINPQVKQLMLDYIFQYVDKVYLHVGATNFRSQIAVQRLGAVKVGEVEMPYYGAETKLNFVYEIPNPKLA